eukprot:6325490-Alexandrium_andersonii.AAC.1
MMTVPLRLSVTPMRSLSFHLRTHLRALGLPVEFRDFRPVASEAMCSIARTPVAFAEHIVAHRGIIE